MLVLDASACVELLMRTPAGRAAEAHLRESDAAFAPELLDVEVLSVLGRLERAGLLDAAGAAEALQAFATASITRVAHLGLLASAWAKRHNVSLFDAVYVALAQELGCPLMTADRRLAGAPGLGITLTLVGV